MDRNGLVVVAFDIDGTWSIAPTAFLGIYNILEQNGFRCIIVTGSNQPREKLDRLLIPNPTDIIVSGNKLKSDAAKDLGFDVDIWIDNEPGTIERCKIIKDNLD